MDMALALQMLVAIVFVGLGAASGVAYEFHRIERQRKEDGLILVDREHWTELWDAYYGLDHLDRMEEREDYELFYEADVDEEDDILDPFYVWDGEEEVRNSNAFQALIGPDEPISAAFDAMFSQTMQDEEGDSDYECAADSLDAFYMFADEEEEGEEEEEVAPVFAHHFFNGQIVAQ